MRATLYRDENPPSLADLYHQKAFGFCRGNSAIRGAINIKEFFMKKALKILGIIALVAVIGLSMAACDLSNPAVKTTLRIVPAVSASQTRSIAARNVQAASFRLYIRTLVVEEDANPRGLHLISFQDMTWSGGRTTPNDGWYDVTEPLSLSVMNDFNVGRYSAILMRYDPVVEIDGVIHGLDSSTHKDAIWFTNGLPPRHTLGPNDVIVPWDPIDIHGDGELIVTFSMDIEGIIEEKGPSYNPETEDWDGPPYVRLIDKWWERITITTELR